LYAILDIETTGGSANFEKITEIAIYIHDGHKVVKEFSTLINPEKTIPYFITRLTGIDNDMVADAPKFYEVAKEIVELTEGMIIVAHNASFDYSFIKEEYKSLGYNFHRNLLCTVRLSRQIIPGYASYSLGKLCRDLGIDNSARHRAVGDAFATVQLFDILLKNDKEGFISKALTGDPAVLKLPPNLDKETLEKIPEETGVYYFYNEKGDIIYIGKSNNIRKRVLNHFAAKNQNKALKMKADICDVTFELTGSELIALLLESDEIKKHKPRYNRAQRNAYFNFGVFHAYNDDGYAVLKMGRIDGGEEPLMTGLNMEELRVMLHEKVQKHRLCQKLTGLYDHSGACFQHGIGECNGACIGKEAPEEYNKRVMQLIRALRYKHQNFLILGQGRAYNEKSVIAIEAGKYLGFGYVENDFQAINPEQLKFFIRHYSDNRDVHTIIRSQLRKHTELKLIPY
jgi:DNA polymerase III subunit epsilon